MPSLILQCSDDAIAPREVGEYLSRDLPGSTFGMLKATGHCPHMSHPEETDPRHQGVPAEGIPKPRPERTFAWTRLLDNAPCGFLRFADDGAILAVNATLLGWLGRGREDLVGPARRDASSPPGGRIFYQTHFFPLLKLHGRAEEIYLSLRGARRRRRARAASTPRGASARTRR